LHRADVPSKALLPTHAKSEKEHREKPAQGGNYPALPARQFLHYSSPNRQPYMDLQQEFRFRIRICLDRLLTELLDTDPASLITRTG
jgi:hypothetical protein